MARRKRQLPRNGTITGLRLQRGSSDWVQVHIDGEYVLRLPTLEAARLEVGQYLDSDDLSQLRQLEEHEGIYQKVLRFLSYRPRSIVEVERYLRGKGIEPAVGEGIIHRLQQLGYLDDHDFALWWAENRQQFSPRGPRALEAELRAKGVEVEVAREAIDAVGHHTGDVLVSLAEKRARRLLAEDRNGFRRKLGAFLQRRGFAYSDIAPVMDRLWEEIASVRDGAGECESD